MPPELRVELRDLKPQRFLQPGRHYLTVTKFSGGLPAEEHNIIASQILEHLPSVQPVQYLGPVKPDELLRI
jgi:hypothetical protein